MTERGAVLQTIASDIVPELDRLLTAFLGETNLHDKQNRGIELRKFLWDNKVGLLRIAQHVALGEGSADGKGGTDG